MSAETPNLDEVRAHAQAVIDRANADSGFADRLKADPEGTLREAGLEHQAIPDFARELSDVEAHGLCTAFTCVITFCRNFTNQD